MQAEQTPRVELHPQDPSTGALTGVPQQMLSVDEAERLLRAYCTRTAGHWLWKGSRDLGGYGVVSVNRRQWRAHRLVWTLLEGPLAPEEVLHHTCPLKACVLHLEKLSSNSEHIKREWEERRGRKGSPLGGMPPR